MNPYDNNPFESKQPEPRNEYDAFRALKETTELVAAMTRASERALGGHDND